MDPTTRYKILDKEITVQKLLTCSSFLAVAAMVCLGSAQAACGGGGFHATGKPGTVTAVPRESASAPEVRAVFFSLDSTRFDAVSSTLALSKGQSKDIVNAKNEINDKGEKLARAQNSAQSKLDNCSGNCADEIRNLARRSGELKSYNTNIEFELRLRSILQPIQANVYFNS